MNTALKNWRSTLAGIAMIVTAVAQIHHANDVAANPSILTSILGGLGLIVTQDAAKQTQP